LVITLSATPIHSVTTDAVGLRWALRPSNCGRGVVERLGVDPLDVHRPFEVSPLGTLRDHREPPDAAGGGGCAASRSICRPASEQGRDVRTTSTTASIRRSTASVRHRSSSASLSDGERPVPCGNSTTSTPSTRIDHRSLGSMLTVLTCRLINVRT